MRNEKEIHTLRVPVALGGLGIVALSIAYAAREGFWQETDGANSLPPCIVPAERSFQSSEVSQIIRETQLAILNHHSKVQAGQDQGAKSELYALTLRKAAYIMYHTPGLKDLEVCPRGKNELVIYGKTFDMNNPSDFILGNTFVEGLFYQKYNQIPSLRLRDHNTLLWLKDNVKIDAKGIPPILPAVELEELARIFIALENTGLRIPRIIRIGDEQPKEGNDVLHLEYSPNGTSLGSKNYLPEFILRQTNLQEAFKHAVPEITQSEALDFLKDYIYRGDHLRGRILYEQERGDSDLARKQNTIYNSTRDVLGVEFAKNALPKKGSSLHRVDTSVEIDDFERPDFPWVLLRTFPGLKPIEGAAVYDEDKVQILSGPLIVFDNLQRTATPYFEIQKIKLNNNATFDPIGPVGVVSNEWLGPTIINIIR